MQKVEEVPVALISGPPQTVHTSEVTTGEVPVQLRSNNPFLKPRPPISSQRTSDDWNRNSNATTNSDPLSQSRNSRLLLSSRTDTDTFQRRDTSQ